MSAYAHSINLLNVSFTDVFHFWIKYDNMIMIIITVKLKPLANE